MKHYGLCYFFLFAALFTGYRPGMAQEFRISTRVFNEAAAREESGRSPVVSRSLTLFHAGKVYDYLDAIGEVIILEPSHNRLTVVNTSHYVAATVDFDEIKRLLKLREQETRKYLEELASSGDARAEEVRAMLEFQMTPQFDSQHDPQQQRAILSSDVITYDVKTATPESLEALEAYLHYADWMARLNSVLHPQALFPGPRVELNQLLRDQQLLPVNVTLEAKLEARIHLRAHHSFVWELDKLDRKLINNWETLMKSSSLERVSLHDYQRRMLLSVYNKSK